MRRVAWLALPVLGAAMVAYRALPDQQGSSITVPAGFSVQELYSSEKAGSVVAINFDPRGNLVIGRQNQPIVTLFDTNGDGVYDEERVFHENARHTQGITFDGSDMIFAGVGPEGTGLYRVVDANGDSRGESIQLIEKAWGNIGDHGPHQPFWGPDGFLYWDQGNGTGIYDAYLPSSPLREYDEASINGRVDPRGHASGWRAPGGIFLRTNAAWKGVTGQPVTIPANTEWELFAGGFRNQYDADFNIMGELFTFDSDMEWDRDLPWYKGTSSVHVVSGGDHGWRSGSMNHPWHYLDNLPPMQDLGRGSPTGVTVLQTYNYPAEYWEMLVQSDWSRGRVIGGKITKNGATYTQTSSNFFYGEPLNVADLAVGPDGNLYFSLGGGGGSGGIYRLLYNGPDAMQKPVANTPVERVLTMIQPRSPFSRELARTTKAQVGERNWQNQLTAVVRSASAPAERRVRALELLQVFGPAPAEALLVSLRNDPSWEVRAASTYYLGMKDTDTARRELVARFRDDDPFVQRRALEAMIRSGLHEMMEPPFSPVADVLPLLSSPDRFVRYQARAVLNATRRSLWQDAAMTLNGYPQAPEGLMAVIQDLEDPRIIDVTRLLARSTELLRANPSEAELLPVIRVIQRTALESYGVTGHSITAANPPAPTLAPLGPDGRVPQQQGQGGFGGGGFGGGQGQQVQTNAWILVGEMLLSRFPAQDTLVSREIARTVAYLGTPGALQKIAAELGNERNTRTQQIFYADQLSYMENGWDSATADRMAGWLEKVYGEQWRGGNSFTGYINYTRDAMLRFIPAAQYAAIEGRMNAAVAAAAAAQRSLAALPPGAPTGNFAAPIADEELFEDLVYRPNVMSGNPAAGVVAYQKGSCMSCHTFGPIGTAFGPDLTTANQRFSRRDLVRAVIFPHEQVSDIYPLDEITRRNGTKVAGIVRESGSNLVVGIAGAAEVVVPQSDVQSRTRSERSPMPEGLLALLNGQEQRNLFALLLAGPAAIPDTALARLGTSR